MNNYLRNRGNSGFTLIEIVIVLAIAALILAAILIFVPQAQKSQRDGQRRNAASRAYSKLTECASNHSGTICTTTAIFGTGGTLYTAGITAPDGSAYTIAFPATAAPASGSACTTADTLNVYSNGIGGQFVQVCLEAGGGTIYQSGT